MNALAPTRLACDSDNDAGSLHTVGKPSCSWQTREDRLWIAGPNLNGMGIPYLQGAIKHGMCNITAEPDPVPKMGSMQIGTRLAVTKISFPLS